MITLPSVFVSHGSPDLPLYPSPARDFLQNLGQQLEPPQAILAISAHWNTEYPTASAVAHPQTVHDFGGFSAELYRISYPAPGAPELAKQAVDLLSAAGFKSGISDSRGLDHGAWNPLLLMYPEADIPVTQLSIQPHLSPTHHFAVGRALESLRQQGVLILASGAVTHNLGKFGGYSYDAVAPDWVSQFSDWLTDAAVEGKVEAMLNYRNIAPHAALNHPTEEHLLPLFVALGAGGEAVKGVELHSSFTYGIFSMAAYAFSQNKPYT